jgi:hypothetical protein
MVNPFYLRMFIKKVYYPQSILHMPFNTKRKRLKPCKSRKELKGDIAAP